jgi:hypothetical protein
MTDFDRQGPLLTQPASPAENLFVSSLMDEDLGTFDLHNSHCVAAEYRH